MFITKFKLRLSILSLVPGVICVHFLSRAFLGWIIPGDVLSLFFARVDIWHPGGFQGNQDSIQYGSHFICPNKSSYMSIDLLRMWSPYMELSHIHPKKATKGQGQCHIKVKT